MNCYSGQMMMPTKLMGKRIPDTLKAVFLASNSGKDVNVIQAPPASVAAKTFIRHNNLGGENGAVRESSPRASTSSQTAAAAAVPEPEITVTSHSNMISQTTTMAMSSSATKEVECTARRVSLSPSTQMPELQLSACLSSSTSSCEASEEETTPSATPCSPIPPPIDTTNLSPQDYLDNLLESRGYYSTQRYETLNTAYSNQPTALQLASYHLHLIDLVRKRDLETLSEIVHCGISLNPCNSYGESLVHTICRLGDAAILKVLVKAGASMQVSDDFGRTPLHDACWTTQPNFRVIDILLQCDRRLLFLMDARGTTPLAYSRKESWPIWIKYLDARKDFFWPKPPQHILKDRRRREGPPPLALQLPNTRLVADPRNALPVKLAEMVVAGKLSAREADLLRFDYAVIATGAWDFEDDDDDSDSDYDSCEEDSSDFESGEDEDSDIYSECEEGEICNEEEDADEHGDNEESCSEDEFSDDDDDDDDREDESDDDERDYDSSGESMEDVTVADISMAISARFKVQQKP